MGHDAGGGSVIRIVVEPEQFTGDRLILTPEQEHYLFRVMRMKPKTSFEAILSGTQIVHCVTTQNSHLAQCVDVRPVCGNPRVFLAQALLKKDLFSEIVERGTEAGICRFYPLVTQRTIVREISEAKWQRWHTIAKEATEQSQRILVPEISQPVSLQALFDIKIPHKVMLDPQGRNIWDWVNDRTPTRRFECLLTVGPEGGFSEFERQQMLKHGFEAVSLGSYVYRAKNAGVFAAALLEAWQGSSAATPKESEAYSQLAQDGDDF